MKLSHILIGIAFVGFIFIGFMMFLSDGVSQYGATGMDATKLAKINGTLNNMSISSQQTAGAMQNLSGLPFGLDVFGGLLVGGYGAIKQASGSAQIVSDITSDSGNILPFGGLFNPFMIFIGTVLLIIIFIAILASFFGNGDKL